MDRSNLSCRSFNIEYVHVCARACVCVFLSSVFMLVKFPDESAEAVITKSVTPPTRNPLSTGLNREVCRGKLRGRDEDPLGEREMAL